MSLPQRRNINYLMWFICELNNVVLITLQYISVSNQHNVHLKLIQCYMSIIAHYWAVENRKKKYICWLRWGFKKCPLCLGMWRILLLLFNRCHVQLFATPWTLAFQAPLSSTVSWSSLRFMSTESVMLSNHLFLCFPLLLLPSIFPSIRFFPNDLALFIRWP